MNQNQNQYSHPLDDNMSLDEAVPRKSKYLTKDDVGNGLVVDIYNMTMDQVEDDRGGYENCPVLHFHGDVKPLIVNQTNKEILKSITGATTIGQLRGQRVVLYNDKTIMFGGKMVGGIRIRAYQQHAPQQAPTAQPPSYPSQDPRMPQGNIPGPQGPGLYQGPTTEPDREPGSDDDIPY